MTTWAVANDRQVRNRNAGEAAHWPVHQGRNERTLPPFTGHLLAAAAIGRADRVALIGYGTRPTTRAAGRTAIDGQARALDLSTAMPRQAARRAQEEGLANVCFEHGDAQVYRFTPRDGDVALSRMGVMLHAGPAAAFTNMARSLGSRRRLSFVCWQNLAATSGSRSPASRSPRGCRSRRSTTRPVQDGSRWANAAGLGPCCAPRRSATSPSSIVANDARQPTHTAPRWNGCIAGCGGSLGVPSARPLP